MKRQEFFKVEVFNGQWGKITGFGLWASTLQAATASAIDKVYRNVPTAGQIGISVKVQSTGKVRGGEK